VAFHDRPLGGAQLSRLQQDAVRYAYLPDVVHLARDPDPLAASAIQTCATCQDGAVVAHPMDVLGCVIVAELGGDREPPDGLLLRLASLRLAFNKPPDRVPQLRRSFLNALLEMPVGNRKCPLETPCLQEVVHAQYHIGSI
jgi:hypothetical protein